MLGPGRGNGPGSLGSHPRHLAHPLRLAVQHLQGGLTKAVDDALGQDWPDLADHARAQVALDVLERGRWAHLRVLGPELGTMARVGVPLALEPELLAWLNGWQDANHGHGLAPPAHAHAQHAETILGVVEGDAVDRAFESRTGS